MNKLLCTFVKIDEIDDILRYITRNYDILYNKIFILQIKSNDEYACTYNTHLGNINELLPNTIMVHRKKHTNTLYTINALNELIKGLNGGVVDVNYSINWQHYKNTILLTKHDDLKQLKTKVFKIVEV